MFRLFRFSFVLALLFEALPTPTSAQWVQTSGPNGGNVWDISSIGSVLFAAGNGAVFRSSDNGTTWTDDTGQLFLAYDALCLQVKGTELSREAMR